GSLVLIDELGTGTDPEEGAALGRAVLEELLHRGAMVLASTHIGALKLFSLEVPRAENASMEFDPESLAPLFRLLVGVPGASHALEVAESLGLPGAVLERARSLTRRDGEEQLLAKVGELRRDAEQIRERARDSEAAARDAQRRIESEEESARRVRDLREREAERAFQELSTDLHALINGAGDRLLARLHGTDREMADRLLKEARERLENNQLGQRWEGFLDSLKKGDVVYVPRFQERLKILKVDQRRNRVKVRRGALEIEVPMREITWVTPPPGKNPV
ncbi:MAG: hypothetical protein O7A67_06340, partial [SAR324 cluster bacterium]|nr:hypothetical protein [SAR324 cluster bacterium]